MPTYSYYCSKCDKTVNVMHSIMEDPELSCKICRSLMKRLVSGGSGTHYRGSGWFSKDNPYRNPKRHYRSLQERSGKVIKKYNI